MRTFVEQVLELHQAFVQAGVPHGFGGAIALAYAVLEPRATDDLDVNVCVPLAEAPRVLAALPPAVPWGPSDLAALRRDGQVRLRWQEERTALDLFFPQHPFHEEVAREIAEVPFAGGSIPVISPTHLAVFKALFNRPKDWLDIEAMLEAQALEAPRVLAWLRHLLGAEDPQTQRFAALAGLQVLGPSPPGRPAADRPARPWAGLAPGPAGPHLSGPGPTGPHLSGPGGAPDPPGDPPGSAPRASG